MGAVHERVCDAGTNSTFMQCQIGTGRLRVESQDGYLERLEVRSNFLPMTVRDDEGSFQFESGSTSSHPDAERFASVVSDFLDI